MTKKEPTEIKNEKSDHPKKKGKGVIYLILLILVLIFASLIILSYLSASSSSDPGTTARSISIIIVLIIGVIIFELLMKPQWRLFNPEAYLDTTRNEPDEEDNEKS